MIAAGAVQALRKRIDENRKGIPVPEKSRGVDECWMSAHFQALPPRMTMATLRMKGL